MTERSASSPAVQCSALTKDYGNGRGIFGFDLAVGAREVLGYIGPNGAGKTTTIRLLMDLIRPDRWGEDVSRFSGQSRRGDLRPWRSRVFGKTVTK